MKKQTAEKLLELVKGNYEGLAADFEAMRQKAVWPELRRVAEMIKDGDRVLDIGCGQGRLLTALAEKQVEYLGVDNSATLIQEAKKNYPERRFIRGDALRLDDIPDTDFNYVFCLGALQHIPSQKLRAAALEEMRNKLSPQGRIIIRVGNLWGRAWRTEKYRRQIFKTWLGRLVQKNKVDFGDLVFERKIGGQAAGPRYYHAFIKQEFKYLAKKSGLKFVSLKKDSYNYWLVLR